MFCTVLLRASKLASLRVVTDLTSLAVEAGLARYDSVKAALTNLEAEGWIKFKPGTQHMFSHGIVDQRGRPSIIELLPKPDVGNYSLTSLPLVTLDPFSTQEAGTAGWFIMARIMFEGRESAPHSGWAPVHRMKDIIGLTDMSSSRVKRTMPKMMESWLCRKEGLDYVFSTVSLLCERDHLGDGVSIDRLKKHWEKQKKLNTLQVGMNGMKFVQRPIPKDVLERTNAIIHGDIDIHDVLTG